MSFLSEVYEKKAFRFAILFILGCLAALSVYAGAKNALSFSQDFQWDAAKALSMRLDPYELSKTPEKATEYPQLEQFYRQFTDRGLKQKMEANQFPSLLMLLWPMTVFSPQTAKTVWLALNLLFTAGIIFFLRKTFFSKAGSFEFTAVTLLMIAGTPYRNQLGVGQHTLFAFFFFMLAVYIDDKQPFGNGAAGSVLTALCLFVSYFKYTLTAPLALLFWYRKRYAALAISVAGHVILTEVAALWLNRSFLYMIKAPLEVSSALVSEGGMDLGVIIGGMAGMAAAVVVFILLFIVTQKLPRDKEYVLFPLLIVWSLIMTYHRTYDYFVLSAAAMIFYGALREDFGVKFKNALLCGYAVLTAGVYFLLRLFNENTASKIAVGTLYYAFSVILLIMAVQLIRTGKNDNG